MGFSEDDRIRAKNRIPNEALDIYEGLKAMGYDAAYMIKYAEFAKESCTCPIRNEVLNTMISIVRRCHESGTLN